jgi:hypothetical protein
MTHDVPERIMVPYVSMVYDTMANCKADSGHIVCLVDETDNLDLHRLCESLGGTFRVCDPGGRIVNDHYIIDFITEDKLDLILLDYDLVDLRSKATES